MNYKKKYDEALNIARELIEQHRRVVLAIFPELEQEANNEKIRKEIIKFIKKRDRCGCDYDYDKWIAYLEKLKTFTEHGEGLYYLHNNDFTYIGGNATNDVEQEVKNTFHCASPKFHIGDWIVRKDGTSFYNGMTAVQITNIDGMNRCWFDYSTWIGTEDIRLWTLQDAKEGDILVVDKRPFIFKGFLDRSHPDYPVAYCGICTNDTFIHSSGDIWWDNNKEDMKPATKEKRELLYKRMKEAGYEWDKTTKELKKKSL